MEDKGNRLINKSYLGPRIMVMVRPSNFGICSTVAISVVSSATFLSSSRATIRQGDLSPAEHDGNLDLVLFLDELTDMTELCVHVMDIRFRAHLDLFELAGGLFLFGFPEASWSART